MTLTKFIECMLKGFTKTLEMISLHATTSSQDEGKLTT